MRIEAFLAATMYIEEHHPHCQGAILAGSAVRGEATATSDLDIVVFDDTLKTSYRESLLFKGWPLEVFVHSLSSYQAFFESDCSRARPSLPTMVSEGMVIKDLGVLASIKAEADLLLAAGPQKWNDDTFLMKRYFLTDVLDDFIGSESKAELLFITSHLAESLAEFHLRANRQWVGESKWVYRSLRNFDAEFAAEFAATFERFYQEGHKEPVIALADRVMAPLGGRLFAGFTVGKKKEGH